MVSCQKISSISQKLPNNCERGQCDLPHAAPIKYPIMVTVTTFYWMLMIITSAIHNMMQLTLKVKERTDSLQLAVFIYGYIAIPFIIFRAQPTPPIRTQ